MKRTLRYRQHAWRPVLTLMLLVAHALRPRTSALGAAAGHADEVAALLDLKAALPGWDAAVAAYDIQLVGWEDGRVDPCLWSFVTACNKHGRVLELGISLWDFWNLSRCHRSGMSFYYPHSYPGLCTFQLAAPLAALSPALNRLPAVTDVILCGLGLTGSIPADWEAPRGLLSRLRVLDLSENQLTGSMPGAGSWHSSASNSQLPRDEAGGSSSKAFVRPLTLLKLTDNRLTGTLPPHLPTLFPNMQALQLEQNQLRGALPQEWLVPEAWPFISGIFLSHNPLGGTLPPALAALPPAPLPTLLSVPAAPGPAGAQAWGHAYRAANSGGSSASGGSQQQQPVQQQQQQRAPAAVPSLVRLLLSDCGLRGRLPADWGAAPLFARLTDLRLDCNQLTGPVPASWGNTSTISGARVFLFGNSLTGPAPVSTHTSFTVWPGNPGLCRLPGAGGADYLATRDRCRAAAGEGAFGPSSSLPSPAAPPKQQRRQQQQQPAPVQPGLYPVVAALPLCAAAARWQHGRAATLAAAAAAAGLAALVALAVRQGRQAARWRWQWRSRAAGAEQQQHARPWVQDTELAWLCPAAAAPDADKHGTEPLPASRVLLAAVASLCNTANMPAPPAAAAAAAASWQLRSASLRLQPGDFTISRDAHGRPWLLGSGAFSKVYRGALFGSTPVAIKVLSTEGTFLSLASRQGGPAAHGGQQQQQRRQEERQRQFWREAEVLRLCAHPNLVKLLGVCSTRLAHGSGSDDGCGGGGTDLGRSRDGDGRQQQQAQQQQPQPQRGQQQLLMIVTELLRGGSLQAALAEPQLRWYRSGGRVALDVARALAFLHQHNIAHLDVKPGNVLLTGALPGAMEPPGGQAVVVAKLADVGLSHIMDHASIPAAWGTLLFAAPEQLLHGTCSLEADMYQLGWLLHSIITGQQMGRRFQGPAVRAPQDCPAAVVHLMQHCLATNPAERPTAATAVRILTDCLMAAAAAAAAAAEAGEEARALVM